MTVTRVTRWLWAFALGCVAVGMLLNESFTPVLFNRYSVAWFAVIMASLAAFASTTAWAVCAHRPASRHRGRAPAAGGSHLLFALAAAAWGASLVTQYPVDPLHVRRLFVGEIFGATQTPGVLLEYLAQFALGLATVLALLRRARTATTRSAEAVAGVLLILGSLAVAYLIAEGATRVVNVIWLEPQGEPTKPTRMWHVRYSAPNRLGFRDRDFESRRQRDEFRLLVLGDSLTYGTGVTDADLRFTAVVGQQLNGHAEFRQVRVFNAGIKGTHSIDHLRIVEQLLWLNPDLVVLAYSFNDIEHLNPLPLGDTPFGASSFWSRFRPHRLLMLNSHLFDQLLLRYRRIVRMHPEDARPDHYLRAYADPDLLSRHVETLAQIAATAQSAGAVFRLVPFDIRVRQGSRFEEAYQRFVTACIKREIPVWSMKHVFEGFSPAELQVNGWDAHPNARAHHLVGTFLAGRILTEASLLGRRDPRPSQASPLPPSRPHGLHRSGASGRNDSPSPGGMIPRDDSVCQVILRHPVGERRRHQQHPPRVARRQVLATGALSTLTREACIKRHCSDRLLARTTEEAI